MTGRRSRTALVAFSAAAALCAGVPTAAFAQATASNGSAASEYGDYVPTTSGTSTPKHTSTPHRTTHHSTPTRHYTPPVRHYVAPSRPVVPVAPRTVTRSAPVAAPAHRARRHHPHHAAVPHRVAKPTPVRVSKPQATVPAAPAASVDGGSGQLVLLGLAMLTMTVAVFTRAGWRRRHGSV